MREVWGEDGAMVVVYDHYRATVVERLGHDGDRSILFDVPPASIAGVSGFAEPWAEQPWGRRRVWIGRGRFAVEDAQGRQTAPVPVAGFARVVVGAYEDELRVLTSLTRDGERWVRDERWACSGVGLGVPERLDAVEVPEEDPPRPSP